MLSQKPEQIRFKFFSFIFNLTLKVEANRPTIQQGSKVFYTPGPNLVILAWTSEQAWGSHTRAHIYDGNTRRPKTGLVGNDKMMVRNNW